MFFKSSVGNFDQILVELFLRYSRFVTGDQKNGPTPQIESVGNTPGATLSGKAELLHIGMFRTLQRIGMWPTERGSKYDEQFDQSKDLAANRLREPTKFRQEIPMQQNLPSSVIMLHRT